MDEVQNWNSWDMNQRGWASQWRRDDKFMLLIVGVSAPWGLWLLN